MGLLIDGQWHDQWYDTKTTGGAFKRQDSLFRHWVRADGSTDFLPESGRYHLYVSLACPWAHRTLIMRKLKGLEAHIDISVVNPLMVEKGWTFDPDPGVIPDPYKTQPAFTRSTPRQARHHLARYRTDTGTSRRDYRQQRSRNHPHV